ncbi:hypothetical protein MAPG_07305 [Magnaporthiopsis poae ATCC 64411]|uniref:Uncharacterized protein n=1 Tax=Magnaporthiopsis poae (strain ATCC 64411 / 73-15) TaxID=644358 RepID=A0A0C4E4B3_MAGP6|nr:hypothetical protein MAPG_07305 [Magnaporthiopsis poae ATCC 64411]
MSVSVCPCKVYEAGCDLPSISPKARNQTHLTPWHMVGFRRSRLVQARSEKQANTMTTHLRVPSRWRGVPSQGGLLQATRRRNALDSVKNESWTRTLAPVTAPLAHLAKKKKKKRLKDTDSDAPRVWWACVSARKNGRKKWRRYIHTARCIRHMRDTRRDTRQEKKQWPPLGVFGLLRLPPFFLLEYGTPTPSLDFLVGLICMSGNWGSFVWFWIKVATQRAACPAQPMRPVPIRLQQENPLGNREECLPPQTEG